MKLAINATTERVRPATLVGMPSMLLQTRFRISRSQLLFAIATKVQRLHPNTPKSAWYTGIWTALSFSLRKPPRQISCFTQQTVTMLLLPKP